MKRFRIATLITAVAALVAFAATVQADPVKRFKPGNMSIADIAVADPGNFSTLVAALSCTNLVGAVADPEAELTVFAPTNAAFGDLGLNDFNVCDLDTPTLTNILLYHVVGERRPSPSVINGKNKEIETLEGSFIYPAGMGSVTIEDANGTMVNIIIPDVLASNGIIHVVDTVLMP